MSKKKWLLLILCILLLAGYWKFFYKTYSETAVAKSADCIFALDVKRVTNTVIWNLLTTPSQWKKISYSRGKEVNWKDMVQLPDYVFVFHSINHPANAWYSMLEIKDDNDFAKGLLRYHFTKGESRPGQQEYFSKELGIDIIRAGDKLLLGNMAVEDKNYIREVAGEMFVQKQFIARKQLFKNIQASSHLSVQIAKNNFLQDDGIIKLNFDKKKITVDALLYPKKQFSLAEHNFTYSADALSSVGFTQPSPSLYNLVPGTARDKISKAVNFNIDSFLLPGNHYYYLNLTGIMPRIDSAISYSYDDDFNKVEKVVVNNVLEPSYNLVVHGDSINNIYAYWNNNGQLERTDTGSLFVPMPFVRSYCRKITEKELSVASAGFQNGNSGNSINCIFFLKILLTKIPADLLKYLPGDITRSIANLESIEITLQKSDEQVKLHGSFNKKDNDFPVIKW